MAVFLTAILLFQIHHLPDPGALRKGFQSADRTILDRQQRIIDEVRLSRGVRRLAWVSVDEAPTHFIDAVLRSEMTPLSLRVAELLAKRPNAGRIRLLGKTLALEIKWSRRELIEAYINLVHYRGELQGVSAASYGLFDKPPGKLTRPEAALMAALIRTPEAPVQEVRERACRLLEVLGAPEECGLLSPEHLNYVEKSYRIRPFVRMAPHLAQRLAAIPQLSGGLIRSTLDRQIQWATLHSLQRQGLMAGAAVVIENQSGHVLAYVGHTGGNAQNSELDETVARRPAGSTLKPFIFAKAIDERILTAASRLEDSPVASRDLVSIRTALTSSLNIPAVRALDLLGVESFVQTLSALGFGQLARADFYGPSLALGSIDVNLLEVVNAYRTLANRGLWSPLRFSPDLASEHTARSVFSPEAAFIVAELLSDGQTSAVLNDGWAVGFSQKFTVAVFASNETGAASVWRELMGYIHQREALSASPPPPGVVRAKVGPAHADPNQEEWFISGTEPGVALVESSNDSRSRISYPLNKSVIDLDQDAPKRHAKVFIQVVAPQTDQNLYLNGQRLGRASALLPWAPSLGKFTLELRDSKSFVVDQVSFEVRRRARDSASL